MRGKRLPIEHCISGTRGFEVEKDLDNVNDIHINKYTFGFAHWENAFRKYGLNEIEEIEICGLCTDICVVSNALILRAYYPWIPITVDASCCAGTTPEKHKAALDVMESCQIDVINR